MNLPEGFLECMKNTLIDDYEDYITHLDKTPFRGMRINTLKADVEFIRNNIGFETKPLPFYDKGFYIDNELQGVGNHPFHHAGAIYLQEPSAMSAVSALEVKPFDKVLDLCAAPGGKTTQIAAELQGKGLLWANEYVPNRAKILYSNIERCGVSNSVVSNADTYSIAENLTGFFDKVLVDAPCSGEGMIRREPNAINEWKIENREMCAKRQLEILNNAAKCVREGGTIVYSTCTLSQEENEITVENFLKDNPQFEIEEINQQFGRNGYLHSVSNKNIKHTRRILFSDGGEGHFIAKFVNKGENLSKAQMFQYNYYKDKIFENFYFDNFNDNLKNAYEKHNIVYLLPDDYPDTKGIKILKAGVKAGEIIKNRFSPSHELFMSKKLEEIKNVENISLKDSRIYDFLHGLEINCDKNGYTGVAVEGIITGFGKSSNGKLKNHYPKGLRIK